jgi:methylated-DNA-[protein]-cysteine S-methyltransferase
MKERGPTPFERRVYAALCEVPAGRVTTYAALARRIGVAAPRAVGQALKRNPDAPRVPCHRVIGADLRAGGYNGRTAGAELRRKLALLADEGVSFGADGRLAEPARLWRFDGC